MFLFLLYYITFHRADLIGMMISLQIPKLLDGLLSHYGRSTDNGNLSSIELYFYATALPLCLMLIRMIYHPYQFSVFQLGMRVRVSCSALIYRKVCCIACTYIHIMRKFYNLYIINCTRACKCRLLFFSSTRGFMLVFFVRRAYGLCGKKGFSDKYVLSGKITTRCFYNFPA